MIIALCGYFILCVYLFLRSFLPSVIIPHCGIIRFSRVDMKNIVKCWKDFLWYSTTLETYRVQPWKRTFHEPCTRGICLLHHGQCCSWWKNSCCRGWWSWRSIWSRHSRDTGLYHARKCLGAKWVLSFIFANSNLFYPNNGDWVNPMTYRILDWKIHNASRELK